jgi:hypothetical protein
MQHDVEHLLPAVSTVRTRNEPRVVLRLHELFSKTTPVSRQHDQRLASNFWHYRSVPTT